MEKYGAEVVCFDPYVLHKSTASSLEEVLLGVKAVVIATSHDLFKEVNPEYLKYCGVEVIVDGQNCIDRERFSNIDIAMVGIGK